MNFILVYEIKDHKSAIQISNPKAGTIDSRKQRLVHTQSDGAVGSLSEQSKLGSIEQGHHTFLPSHCYQGVYHSTVLQSRQSRVRHLPLGECFTTTSEYPTLDIH